MSCGTFALGEAPVMIIADGIIISLNYYDTQIYAFGKGSSGTTVSAPQIVPSLGSSVMITGTVTDQSPSGRRTVTDSFDFTLKGTPAISDADMKAWMEYMFMQQAKPTNATGVPVSLDAIDPNGNYIHIGDTTSDTNGNYGLQYTPEVPGTYQIIATFHGSNSYGSSSATTYLAVGSAPATPAPTATPQSNLVNTTDLMTYMAVGIIVIIIAIAIATLLMLRKRP